MTLKQSFFNVEIDELTGGELLLFNTLTTAFGIVEKKMRQLYETIEEVDIASITDDELLENIKVMRNHKFLVDKDIDELKLYKYWERTGRYSSDTFGLTIAPTLNCNMRCPYCYEDKLDKAMDDKTQEALIKFVKNKLESGVYKKFATSWFGGEPLLKKDIIEYLSGEFIRLCKENNIEYKSEIITNGILLDRETALMLKEKCKVSFVQITVDGIREIHNKRRILASHGDSFEIITNNIDAAKDIIFIMVRCNIDRTNINEAEKLIDYFLTERKWGEAVGLYFAPVENISDHCKTNSSHCYSRQEFGLIESDLLRKIYDRGSFKLIQYLYPTSQVVSCAAISTNFYVVDPLGNLYKCWDVMSDSSKNVGDIFNGELMNRENLNWLCMDTPIQCLECNLLPLCNGGCPHRRLINDNTPTCWNKTVSFKENLRIVFEEYKKLNHIYDCA